MEDNTRLQELSDEELSQVAGGGHGGHSPASILQQNNVWLNQIAKASGFGATAFNIAVIAPININIER